MKRKIPKTTLYESIRNYAEYEEGEYKIVTYQDFFFGEWVGNEELYHKGKLISHATLTGDPIKAEDLPGRLANAIKLHEHLKNENRKQPIKKGTLNELIRDVFQNEAKKDENH